MEEYVSFPKLGLEFNTDRSFSVFGLEIHWYGVIICIGMLLCIILGLRFCKKYKLNSEQILDYVICAVPSAIVGARLYYVIFSWDSYKDSPIDIFKIWNGGLAIYGGIIGAVLAIFIVSRIKKDNFLHLLDFGIPYIMLGQAIGRWGNFINQEAYGGATDLFWGMTGSIIERDMGEGVLVHPTFLYESLWCFAGFAFLVYFRLKKQKAYGEITALYMCIYGIERAFVEQLRMDSLMISIGSAEFRVSQLLSLALVVVGIALFIDSRKRGTRTFREAERIAAAGGEQESSLAAVIEAMEENEAAADEAASESETEETTEGELPETVINEPEEMISDEGNNTEE